MTSRCGNSDKTAPIRRATGMTGTMDSDYMALRTNNHVPGCEPANNLRVLDVQES